MDSIFVVQGGFCKILLFGLSTKSSRSTYIPRLAKWATRWQVHKRITNSALYALVVFLGVAFFVVVVFFFVAVFFLGAAFFLVAVFFLVAAFFLGACIVYKNE